MDNNITIIRNGIHAEETFDFNKRGRRASAKYHRSVTKQDKILHITHLKVCPITQYDI